MCVGPVKVRWGDSEDKNLVDNKLLILLGLDMIVIDKDRPNTASNEYDFYFVAREKIIASDAKISFFFPPFPIGDIKGYKNYDLPKRKDKYLNWQLECLATTISNPNKNLAHSLGWDEQEMRSVLPLTFATDTREALNSHLARLREAKYAPNLEIEVKEAEPIPDNNNDNYAHHFVATLNGEIDQGDFFHIYFILKDAQARESGQPCSAEALLYYYDTNYVDEWRKHPFKDDLSVPCAFLQVAMFFQTPLTSFKPNNFKKFRVKEFIAPIREPYIDGRWFVICTPLSRPPNQEFYCKWQVKDCPKTHSDFLRSNLIFGVPDKKYTYDLFMLMPYSDKMDIIYKQHIMKVAKKLSLTIDRAKEFRSQKVIMQEIWSAIAQASILIADCTSKNANVFYEIGLAHALDKPVILITQNEEDVPFDIRFRRYIHYSYTPPGMKEFESNLKATILETRKDLGLPTS